MRIYASAALVLAAVSIGACDRSNPVQPSATSTAAVVQASPESGNAATSPAGKPEIDPTYANGTVVYMIGPHVIVDARTKMPNAYAHAEELYLVVYPQASLPLPSGYKPQCDPCFHPGLPAAFVHHDHVITGAPGMGNNGTAGQYKAPWKIILVMYNPAYVASPTFKPITSATDLDAAEQAGNVFLQINAGGANPYEVETGNLLICPTVSSHA